MIPNEECSLLACLSARLFVLWGVDLCVSLVQQGCKHYLSVSVSQVGRREEERLREGLAAQGPAPT